MTQEEYSRRVDRLRFQLVESWCLCKWCQMFNSHCDNFQQYNTELQFCIENMKSPGKKAILTEMLVEDYDYDDANMIERIVRGRFTREKINDHMQKAEACRQFADNIHKIIAVIYSDIPDTLNITDDV